MKNRIESIKLVREVDNDSDFSYLGEYGAKEWPNSIDRQERGECGHNEYRYFTPAMTVIVNGTIQRIRSGGLWGIESDSEPAYFRTIGHDELCDLRATLAEMGFSKRQLADGFHGIEDSEFVDK